jgi:hypothetical protein
MNTIALSLAVALVPAALAMEFINEIKIMEGHKQRSHIISPLPHT